jgi:hypothetical protein
MRRKTMVLLGASIAAAAFLWAAGGALWRWLLALHGMHP